MVKFGEPAPYHEKNLVLIGGLAVSGVLLLILMIMCWKFKCCQRIKGKFMKKEITYEMYG